MTGNFFGGNNGERTLELFSGLLACEDITIKHNAYLQTAMFDLKSRTLSLPVWQNITDHLYCLFVGHEVAHALFTVADESFWINCDSDLKNIINVVEDVRVDKLIKAKYPGLKTDYIEGTKDLVGRGFYPTDNLSSLDLVDRLNVHFRLGDTGVNVPFADDEIKFVPKVASCISFESVVAVSKEILEFLKKKQEEKNKTKESGENKTHSDNGQQSSECDDEKTKDTEESDSNESNASGDNDSEESDSEESKSGNDSQESDSEESDEDDKNEKSNSSEFDENESDEQETESKTSELESTGQSENKAKTVQEMLDEKIREAFTSKNIYEISRKSSDIEYIDLPTSDVTNAILSYKETIKKLRTTAMNWNRYYGSNTKPEEQNFSQIVKSHNEPTVNYLVKEFELRKSAKIRSRSKISKTGLLNSNKLYSYEYNEDLFKKSVVMEKGKNHGVVILFDMSGSMGNVIFSVHEQILNVVMFCKKVKIPFEVFGFTTGDNYDYRSQIRTSQVSVENISLKNYFSSKMTQTEFAEAYNLFSTMICNRVQYEGMAGTPLVKSLVVMNQVIEKFKASNSLDIVSLLVISDGADSEGIRINGNLMRDNNTNSSFIVRDRLHSNQTINDEKYRSPLTKGVLQIIKTNHNCNVVCFYLTNQKSCYGTEEQQQTYKSEGFYLKEDTAYDKYFVVSTRNGFSLNDDEDDLEDVDYMPSITKLRNRMQKIMDKKITRRIFLRKFIETIA